MRIALPVDERTKDTAVCVSFGRAPFFMIADTEAHTEAFIENTAAASQGGAGIKAAQLVVDQAVTVLLTPRVGENAADVIQGAGIQMYRTIKGSAHAAIEAYQNGQLTLLDEVHPGHHGHGHQK